ncbi:MAG TPA: M48 family metallopeptidase [Caldimonas sp.]
MTEEASTVLEGVDYFDGLSAHAHRVTLRLAGRSLVISGAGIERSVPVRGVRWPERTRHGARSAHLAEGGSLHCANGAAWDRWVRAGGQHDSIVVRMQQSWRWALGSVGALAALLAALYLWGIPLGARLVVVAIPASVDAALGDAALEAVDQRLMQASTLPEQTQARVRAAFERALGALAPEPVPAHRIVFRNSRIGPNAFALPGGTMVMTDQLVELVDGDEGVLVGVLAHELGHVRQRHAMRMVVQATAIGAVASLVLGDFSSLLASAPALLSQASYSRDAEREADAESVRVLRAAGISPAAMVTFFEKIAQWRNADSASGGSAGSSGLGIAIASHPADQERVRFFRQAAGP